MWCIVKTIHGSSTVVSVQAPYNTLEDALEHLLGKNTLVSLEALSDGSVRIEDYIFTAVQIEHCLWPIEHIEERSETEQPPALYCEKCGAYAETRNILASGCEHSDCPHRDPL